MGDLAVRVAGLAKSYRLGGGTPSVYARDALAKAVAAPWRWLLGRGRPVGGPGRFWALDDVSFDVRAGEVVGVIGRNGAGKSTLLKILSRITSPDRGEADLHGRVGSLLEVGTGFHPELTGRENVFLNGAILGMSRAEVRRKFDEIVAFSEVEAFIDTPVKFYSSGMAMRLAFAVAAHLEPEILVIDEVLAVGDAAFQKKCLGKMGEVARGGRTVLFVSHNLSAVQSLCGRVVALERGRVTFDGDAKRGVAAYLQAEAGGSGARTWDDDRTAPGGGRVRLLAARLIPAGGRAATELTTADGFTLEFAYRVVEGGLRLNLAVQVYTGDEVLAFASPSLLDPVWAGRPFPAGVYRTTCRVPGHLLNDGPHAAAVLFVADAGTVLDRVERAIEFTVHDGNDGRGEWYGKWAGVVRPRLEWATETREAYPPDAI